MTEFTVAPRLPDEVLAKRDLPLKPEPVTLSGRIVRLEPLDMARDVEPLYAVSNGQPATLGKRTIGPYDAERLIWRYMFAGPFDHVDDFAAYLRTQVEAVNGLPLCVFDVVTNQQIGMANYMSNVPQFLKVELGSIWYTPLAQRIGANTEATYLMLQHAFSLGYRRVEWKCDNRNERSRQAAEHMGFQFEGVQEYHMIVKNRNRDTAWFRILDHEWPAVQRRLEMRLYG